MGERSKKKNPKHLEELMKTSVLSDESVAGGEGVRLRH